MSLGCLRFRPIRRDSDSAESQSSASLVGSAPDVEVLPARRPPRSAGAPTVAHTDSGTAQRHRRLKPAWSSNGSASSYDNLDETSNPPRHARQQPWLPQPRSSRLVRPAATKVASSGTDEAFEEPGQRLTPGAPSNVDVGSGSTSVWRRPTLDGHIQVVPPTMIGVFDPTSQLSKFAAQTSVHRTSHIASFQRQSGNTGKVSETIPVPKNTIRFDGVTQPNRVRSSRTFDTINIYKSPQGILAQNSQPLESNKAAELKSCSSCSEPPELATCKTPDVCDSAARELAAPLGDVGGHSSTSSSSSTDDDQDNVEHVKVDDKAAFVSTTVQSPVMDLERRHTPTTPVSGSRLSTGGSPAAVDVSERQSDQATTGDEQSTATSSVTPSRTDAAIGGHVADSFPVSTTSLPVNEANIQGSSDVDVVQRPDVENEATSSSSTSSQSNSSVSSHDEQDADFVEQTELRISETDHGTSPFVLIT